MRSGLRPADMVPGDEPQLSAAAVRPMRFVAGCQHWTNVTGLAFGAITIDFEVPGANVVHSV